VRRFETLLGDVTQELRREIRKVGRDTLISLIIITGVLNTTFFTAYAIVLTR
jgi:hypothetical protein